jgi:large subunit ribosomal protein L24
MNKIRKGDQVQIITGKDKGKRGIVVRVRDDERIVVEGVNVIKRHTKPNPNLGTAGGIVEKEAPLHISNVAIFNPVTLRPSSNPPKKSWTFNERARQAWPDWKHFTGRRSSSS